MSELIGGICVFGGMALLSGLKSVKEHQKLAVFRFGKFAGIREPGLRMVLPLLESCQPIDMRVQTISIPTMTVLTLDQFVMKISAACLYKVTAAEKAATAVNDLPRTVAELADLALRSKSESVDALHLLLERKRIGDALKADLQKQVRDYGVTIIRYELKEVQAPKEVRKHIARKKVSRANENSQVASWTLDLSKIL